MSTKSDRIAFLLFITAILFAVFGYGYAVGHFHIFPYTLFNEAEQGFKEVHETNEKGRNFNWFYKRLTPPHPPPIQNSASAYPGLNLITRVAVDYTLEVQVANMEGEALHTWQLDWFEIWPDVEHLAEKYKPKSRPGTHIHGAVLMDNGDLIFNFEHRGLVRINPKGEVVWRFPHQTHHSVHVHSDGNLWVCGQREHLKAHPNFSNRIPPFSEYLIFEITPDGQLQKEWSIAELLAGNGYEGLLHLNGKNNVSTKSTGDNLHLNDVEPFPDHIKPGLFEQGDVLVSLRNINTVFVFNRASNKIKYLTTGRFIRQHDPDFIDGNTISVFDNNNIPSNSRKPHSKITLVDASTGSFSTHYTGSLEQPFFTDIMGKHQWLPNGNLLITSSREGRAFEINANGDIVWEYYNDIEKGIIGLLEEVQRIPIELQSIFGYTI